MYTQMGAGLILFGNDYVADISSQYGPGEYPILFVDHEDLGSESPGGFFASDYISFLEKAVWEMITLYTPDGRLKP